MREDLSLAQWAKEQGFKVINNGNHYRSIPKEYSPEQLTPCRELSFEIGNVVAYATRSGWRFAELINKKYTNHSEFCTELKECLKLAKNNQS